MLITNHHTTAFNPLVALQAAADQLDREFAPIRALVEREARKGQERHDRIMGLVQKASPLSEMAEHLQGLTTDQCTRLVWSSLTTKPAPAAKPVQVQAEPIQATLVKPSALPTTREIAAALRARAVAYRHAGYSLAELCRSARLQKNSWCELARIAKGVRKGGLNTLTVDRLSAALTARGF